MKSYGRVEV